MFTKAELQDIKYYAMKEIDDNNEFLAHHPDSSFREEYERRNRLAFAVKDKAQKGLDLGLFD